MFSAIKSIIDINRGWDDWSYLTLLFSRTFTDEHVCSLRVSTHSFWTNQSMNGRFNCLTCQRFCWCFHTEQLKLNCSPDFDAYLFWMSGMSRTICISIYYWNSCNREDKKRQWEIKFFLFRKLLWHGFHFIWELFCCCW